ncbi:MAG: choice-of-anchor I family protein [Bacteroidota bacterium]
MRLFYLSTLLMLLVTVSLSAQQMPPIEIINSKSKAVAAPFELFPISSFSTGIFDEGAAEIVAYDKINQNVFSTNADANTVSIIDISVPASPILVKEIPLSNYGGGVNSVAIFDTLVAIAIQADEVDGAGSVLFTNLNGDSLNLVTVGVLPDMVTFNRAGDKVLTANEGEPSDDYMIDPEGSISIIDLSNGIANAAVNNLSLESFNTDSASLVAAGVRIYGPGASVAQDLEPEYITVTPDDATAAVVCQENNALIIIDMATETISAILPLGFKDHSLDGNGFDASNRSDSIDIRTHPVLGMYQPDAIKSITIDGTTYLVTANEGDARDYDAYSEETRVGDLTLDPTAYPEAATLQMDENLGRLRTTDALGDTDGDGDFDQIYSYGARSFTIWNAATGALVWDSGDIIERKTAELLPNNFNSNNDENDSFKSRSDDKGPEPEAIELVEMDGNVFALVGLERVGGVMVFDITDPTAPLFSSYVNNRDFSVVDVEAGLDSVGDLGVEDVIFIEAADSPTGSPMVITANEVSGTVSLFSVNDPIVPDSLVVAFTEVALDGTRPSKRRFETNQGNLVADAYVWLANKNTSGLDPNIPIIAVQNARNLGLDQVIPANSEITAGTIRDIMSFSNDIVLLEPLSPQLFKDMLENSVAAVERTGGRFLQISGFSFVWDTLGYPGFGRIESAMLDDGTMMIENYEVVDGAPDVYTITNDFVAGGGASFDEFLTVGVEASLSGSDFGTVLEYITAEDGLDSLITAAQYPEGGEGRIVRTAGVSPFGADSDKDFTLIPIGTFETGIFDEGAAEIVAYDAATQRAFFTNSDANTVTILDISSPSNPSKIADIDMSTYGGGINSVAVHNGIVAAAVEGNGTMDNGTVVFMDTDGMVTNTVTVGVLPDMVTFTPDGNKVITANEGEPSDDYTMDPEGSVSIIDISSGVMMASVTNVTFESLNADSAALVASGVRIFGPGASVAQDLEPEYIAVTENSAIAVAVCQENNAIARIDLTTNSLIDVLPLGFKNHAIAFNGFDASNRSDSIDIKPQPTLGMYQPDAIKSVNIDGIDYFVTANEGDARDYDGYSEEERVKDLSLYSFDYSDFMDLQMDENLGRLNTTNTSLVKSVVTSNGSTVSGVSPILSYGARSFSIWDANGALIFDSGDFIERKIAEIEPENFNSNNDENDSFKARSDDKGPEPEAIEIAKLDGSVFALVGLERIGGVMVFDITNPTAPAFVSYLNNRDFSVMDVTTSDVGDLGIEDIRFIPVDDSPADVPLVLTANEVSGTITIFAVNGLPTSTKDILNLASFDVQVGPNPFVENMNISYTLDNNSQVAINLIDATGRLIQNVTVESQTAGDYNYEISVPQLAPGMYYVLMRVNDRIAARPVVKQ